MKFKLIEAFHFDINPIPDTLKSIVKKYKIQQNKPLDKEFYSGVDCVEKLASDLRSMNCYYGEDPGPFNTRHLLFSIVLDLSNEADWEELNRTLEQHNMKGWVHKGIKDLYITRTPIYSFNNSYYNADSIQDIYLKINIRYAKRIKSDTILYSLDCYADEFHRS